MIIPDLFREFNGINQYKEIENYEDEIPSSLPENMNISPSMVLSSSPATTDWLRQFAYGTDKLISH